jgi:hypothetical protein
MVAPAAFKPLEVALIKTRPELRIDAADDDLVLADLIQGAMELLQSLGLPGQS